MCVSYFAFPALPIWFDVSIWEPKCWRQICGMHSLQERKMCCGIVKMDTSDKSSSFEVTLKKSYPIATTRDKQIDM